MEALDLALQARVIAGSEGKNIEYTPPSESEFVAAVAKDVARDMLSPRVIGIIVAIIVILVILVAIWFSRAHGG
jgi:hypothetical protein